MNEDNVTLVVQYLKEYHNSDYIKIRQYEIQGAELNVQFYTDETEHNIEATLINIWEMLLFLHQQ